MLQSDGADIVAKMDRQLSESGRVWTRFSIVNRVVRQRADRAVRDATGLSALQMCVLWFTEWSPRSRLRMQELAECLQLEKSALTHLVDRMSADGLVSRERAQKDRRGLEVVLTAKGKAVLDRTLPAYLDGIEDSFAHRLPPERMAVLMSLLDELIDGVVPLDKLDDLQQGGRFEVLHEVATGQVCRDEAASA